MGLLSFPIVGFSCKLLVYIKSNEPMDAMRQDAMITVLE